MKKFYTLFAAVAVSALACSAAQPMSLGEKLPTGITPTFAKSAKFATELTAAPVKKAPAAKAAAAPASLDGLTYALFFDVIEDDIFPVDNDVTFTAATLPADDEDLNELYADFQGYDVYKMTNFANGLYRGIDFYDLYVFYSPEYGELILPSAQNFCDVELTDGSNVTLTIWNYDNEYLYHGIPFFFEFDGSGFDYVRDFKYTDEDGTVETFTSAGMLIGEILSPGAGVSVLLQFDSFYFAVPNGKMTYKVDITDDSGKTEVVDQVCNIMASVEGDLLILENFQSVTTVPFTVDVANKALSAEDVLAATYAGYSFFYSDAEDMWNKYPEGEYKLTATYTTTDDSTTITIPEWNAFAIMKGEDANYYYKLYNGVITLQFNIESEVSGSGVANIGFDANAPVEYFNLQGIRVENPTNGLYIRRQGNKAAKIIL